MLGRVPNSKLLTGQAHPESLFEAAPHARARRCVRARDCVRVRVCAHVYAGAHVCCVRARMRALVTQTTQTNSR